MSAGTLSMIEMAEDQTVRKYRLFHGAEDSIIAVDRKRHRNACEVAGPLWSFKGKLTPGSLSLGALRYPSLSERVLLASPMTAVRAAPIKQYRLEKGR